MEDGFYTDPDEDGAVPNFFELDDTHVLLFFSHDRGPQYYVGEYDGNDGFDIENHGRLNHGQVDNGNLHAPSVLREDERRIAFFNVVEGIDDWQDDPGDGWAGVVGLPRDLSVVDGNLRLDPVEELTKLRRNHRRAESVTLSQGETWQFPESGGKSLELRARIEVGNADQIDLNVLESSDSTEVTTVSYWDGADSIGINTDRASIREDVRTRPPEVGSLELDDERLDFRVFVDKSIVEVFANGRETLTTRVYPNRTDSTGISLVARRGEAHLDSLDVWDMASIWSAD